VLHWNIAGTTTNVGDTTKPGNMGTGAVVDRLVEFATERAPHIVSMNETCRLQADQAVNGLEDQFGSAEMHFTDSDGYDPLCEVLEGESGSAVIAVGADSVTDKRSYYLNDDGTITSEKRERAASCLTANFQTTLGQSVRACSLHLHKDDPIAAVQAEGFANAMTEDGPQLPLVLAGDFNAAPHFFPGVYAPVHGGEGQFLEVDFPANTQTFYAGEKLDYIFGDRDHFGFPSGQVIDRGTCSVLLVDRPCSDHHALYGELPFRDPSTPPDNGAAPVVSAGRDVSGDEGTPILLEGKVADDSSYTTVSWAVETESADPGATCQFARPRSTVTTVTCTDEGAFTVTLTADDGVNPPVSDSAVVTVRNAPPVLSLTGPAPWQLFRADTPVDLVASFTDAANDTHTCTVDWDDPGTPEQYDGAGGSCNRSHVFADAGMYTIRVTVMDDDGASDSAEVMVVVYDPDAGFANADGSVASAAGSYPGTPTAAGEGWFHLTARYYGSNATVPTGTARMWLTSLPFRVDADSPGLEWLAVTPDGKIAAKGKGRASFMANGTGEEMGYVFYGYDGCANGSVTSRCQPGPDRFRMVVWPLSAGPNPGENIRYDNRRGAGLDVDVADPQPLLSGQVLIQR